MVNDDILSSIKQQLGIPNDVVAFDPELRIHINGILRTINEIGIGSRTYSIPDDTGGSWKAFIDLEDPAEPEMLDQLPVYTYLRIRLLFDPPTNAFLVTSLKEQAKELEWRLEVWGRNIKEEDNE